MEGKKRVRLRRGRQRRKRMVERENEERERRVAEKVDSDQPRVLKCSYHEARCQEPPEILSLSSSRIFS